MNKIVALSNCSGWSESSSVSPVPACSRAGWFHQAPCSECREAQSRQSSRGHRQPVLRKWLFSQRPAWQSGSSNKFRSLEKERSGVTLCLFTWWNKRDSLCNCRLGLRCLLKGDFVLAPFKKNRGVPHPPSPPIFAVDLCVPGGAGGLGEGLSSSSTFPVSLQPRVAYKEFVASLSPAIWSSDKPVLDLLSWKLILYPKFKKKKRKN